MIEEYREFPLATLNTFRMNVKAKRFIRFTERKELEKILATVSMHEPLLFLGGGSNILFTGNFEGTVLQYSAQSIVLLEEDSNSATISVTGGYDWDDWVAWTVDRSYFGLENLSLIPGLVGAAPIQNIGAYGVEVKDYLLCVEGYDLIDKEWKVISKEACEFGYRDSVFKHALKGRFFVERLVFRLDKFFRPKLEYGQLDLMLGAIENLSSSIVRNTIISIRESKLPDPVALPNAGSFFKNPVITDTQFLEIKKSYTTIPSFYESEGFVKIPAGWLIEQCGFKGKRIGNVGIHEHQALVIVNYGKGSPEEIIALSRIIICEVKLRFDIELKPEVNFV